MGYAKEWLTVDEWQRLETAPDQKEYSRGNPEMRRWRDELLLRTTYRGGLRISEALDLQYPYNFQSDEENGYVVLYGSKTDDDPNLQPVGKDLNRDISRFMNAYGTSAETNYVFTNGQGSAMTRQRAYQLVNEYGDIAGIDKKLGTHTLRRSRAKHLLDSGAMELSGVSQFLRHDNLSTTMNYLKIAKKAMADKAGAVDEELGL